MGFIVAPGLPPLLFSLSMPDAPTTGQFGSLFRMVCLSFHHRSLPTSSCTGVGFACVKGASAQAKEASKGVIHKPLTKPWRTWTIGYLFLC
jgi:hypothetical protein